MFVNAHIVISQHPANCTPEQIVDYVFDLLYTSIVVNKYKHLGFLWWEGSDDFWNQHT